ncbi:hypothetical protein L3Y34_011794 [Caenorhabditis briggsae]|uniref:Uncharacterized protein n=1 Tax=Caenorhabditis briggsae TaxID=6238 RepID=A0AAE8ZPT6_CAEBR|nr:hypothetical protein L3Y34_011794 [Caenorhabditis briggsae]
MKSFYDGEDFYETLIRTKFDKLNMDLYRAIIQKEPSHGINPDEAVAYGAAIQGASGGVELKGSGNNQAVYREKDIKQKKATSSVHVS